MIPFNQQSKVSHSNTWRIRLVIVVCAILVAGVFFVRNQWDASAIRSKAEAAFQDGNFHRTVELANQLTLIDPSDAQTLLLLGKSYEKLKDHELALQSYEQVPEESAQLFVDAKAHSGHLLMHTLGDPSKAEIAFRQALEVDPDHVEAAAELATLLGVVGRQQDAIPFILRFFKHGQVTVDLLTLLGQPNGRIQDEELFELFEKRSPGDPQVRLALAWDACNSPTHMDLHRARSILEAAVQRYPQFAPLRVLLISVLWQQEELPLLREHLKECFENMTPTAELWNTRGKLAERDGETNAAIRCYWEAYQLDPVDTDIVFNLSKGLDRTSELEVAHKLENWLNKLHQTKEARDVLLSSEHTSTKPLQVLIQRLFETGRLWEAWGWCMIARQIAPAENWSREQSDTLWVQLRDCPLRAACGSYPQLPEELGNFSLPEWRATSVIAKVTSDEDLPAIAFQDQGHEAGLDFQYFNGVIEDEGQRMFEFPGGGCGVVDYDNDGWPDFYFPQGSRHPQKQENSTYFDALFRNLGNGRFAEITGFANLDEQGFSTGVTVGDYDSDGFQDVYVANIGANSLYRNNGDGTFENVTDRSDTGDDRWTSSCVMVDVNGDSLPDIYSVNYLTADDIYERICHHRDGKTRMCMPFQFSGSQDQLYLNNGEGGFANVTSESGINELEGKGLGIVAADFNGDTRVDLYVANDTVPNFLLINQGTILKVPQFVDEGLFAGVALNEFGQAEGSMGIAVGDIDANGLLDLFVTNFYQETNTCYLQQTPGVFEDRTQLVNLAEDSLPLVGFGTQFTDVDLDGQLDLILTNGHIDDLSAYGRPYKMESELYWNQGQGHFRKVPANVLGSIFRDKALGRGVAICDWNRDGLEDAVISFLDRPPALLTNQTIDAGNFLSIQFVGVQSSRDAIGVRMTLKVGDRKLHRQLTGGGGYQVCNSKKIIIGLGNVPMIDELIVEWPSGHLQVFRNVPANQELAVIESQEDPYVFINGTDVDQFNDKEE